MDVVMPASGMAMTEATLTAWLVAVGDTVEAGQVLAEVETDKAIVEVESEHAGVVLELLAVAGESVEVGTVIARIDG